MSFRKRLKAKRKRNLSKTMLRKANQTVDKTMTQWWLQTTMTMGLTPPC